MSKTVLAEVDGFTPVIDDLLLEHGYMAALVFGKAWRYCQMSDGVCRASQSRMADELGVSRKTINDYFEILVTNKYLEDLTPNLIGLPHTYRDTGKANLSFKVTGGKNIPVTESYTPCNPELQVPVTESYTKKVVKKEKDTLSDKSKKQANQKMDAILAAEAMATGRSWTLLPAGMMQDFGKVMTDHGLVYTKKQFNDWCGTFNDWWREGFLPTDAAAAFDDLIKMGWAGKVSRPDSVTWKLRGNRTARVNSKSSREPVYPTQPEPEKQGMTFEEAKAAGIV